VWEFATGINGGLLNDELGWPELVETVAGIYAGLPADERAQTGVFAGNYGEAGALNLYGPAYGLPEAISADNTYWLRGYGDPPPRTLIVAGLPAQDVHALFADCRLAGHNTNRYGVENEESVEYPDIFVCGGPRQPWPAFWESLLNFG
jgi:hypothetical protein